MPSPFSLSIVDSFSEQEVTRLAAMLKVVDDPWHGDGWLPRDDGWKYNPSAPVLEFLESPARYTLIAGARGSGKTAGGAQKAFKRIRKGLDGIVLSPSIPHFNTSTREEFWKWIPWDHVDHHYKTDKMIEFDTGSKVYYGGIEDEDRWRGPNVNWLWFDEAARKPDNKAWLVAIGGVRVGENPAAWITTTPRGKNHWIYNMFIKQEVDEVTRSLLDEIGFSGKLYEHFFVSIFDNKANLDPMFLASMLSSYTGKFREQEIMGKFVDFNGEIISRDAFGEIDAKEMPPVTSRVRFWDLAATEKKQGGSEDPDWLAGGKVSRTANGVFYIEHIEHARLDPADVETRIRGIALKDGINTEIGFEQEPGASGKSMVSVYVRMLAGLSKKIRGYRLSGDRLAAAMPWFSQAMAGNVKVVKGKWNEPFYEELESFPAGAHDDMVTSLNGAFMMLFPKYREELRKYQATGGTRTFIDNQGEDSPYKPRIRQRGSVQSSERMGAPRVAVDRTETDWRFFVSRRAKLPFDRLFNKGGERNI